MSTININPLGRPALILLVLTNLIPVYLVLVNAWSVSQIVLLFWMENVIIGILNVLKMYTCQPRRMPRTSRERSVIHFFMLHYGMFTLVHGIFVVLFFFFVDLDGSNMIEPGEFGRTITSAGFWWSVTALWLSHLFSLYWHFFRGGERELETLDDLMFKPYGRVVILHITILGGAILAASLGQPIWALLVLVGLKILIDVAMHTRSHRKVYSQ